jgi:hypothetical protein
MQSLDGFAKSDLDKLERLAENFEWIHKQYDNFKKSMITSTGYKRQKDIR